MTRVLLCAGLPATLGACEIHVAGDDLSGPIEMRWVAYAGPDERDFDSPCRHFGNVTPFSDKPVYQC
jgi:hypothetical protein